VILGAVALSARAQPFRESPSAPAPQKRILSGRVLTDQTGDPIANARVILVSSGQGTPVVLTDHDGRFALTAPLTRATIAASKSGYSRSEMTASLQDESIEIRLSRGAAISGRVRDEFGDPVVGARIVAEAVKPAKNAAAVATAEADDRGVIPAGQPGAGSSCDRRGHGWRVGPGKPRWRWRRDDDDDQQVLLSRWGGSG
jgi:hypothetical protein